MVRVCKLGLDGQVTRPRIPEEHRRCSLYSE